jgi:hypothetical protein
MQNDEKNAKLIEVSPKLSLVMGKIEKNYFDVESR